MDMFKMRKLAMLCLYLSILSILLIFVIPIFIPSANWDLISNIIKPISFVLFASYIVISLIYWRCPYCKKSFGIREHGTDIEFCPYCGCKLK